EEGGVVGDGKGGGRDAAAAAAAAAAAGANGGASGAEDSDSSRGSTRPKRRRRQPWLRGLFTVFLVVEALVLYAVNEYSPVYDFEVLSVTTTAEDGTTTVVGDNPDLSFPLSLAGEKCGVSDMAACVTEEPTAAALSTVCCTELLDPDSAGPDELISSVVAFCYVVVIPGLILLVRGLLLGRMWTLRPTRGLPCLTRDQSKAAWGKKRWHLRVGFFALDAFLGLFAAVVTASLFSTVAKVTVGRPRPNYYALLFYTEHTLNGQDFHHWSITSWPSGHAATAMSGLVFLAYVLWSDLVALVMWRRRAHPRLSLVLVMLGGFVVALLPMSAILIGVTRIREYWHRPDDVLVGFIMGFAAAHWAFHFAVLLPFRHEIGSPEWKMNPKWLDEEEQRWEEEDEELRLCGWRRRGARLKEGGSRTGASSSAGGDVAKGPSLQAVPPARVAEADDSARKLDLYA
ncbi:unnamed protein product, partial [Ectocarpus sp. 6 AP-2014]